MIVLYVIDWLLYVIICVVVICYIDYRIREYKFKQLRREKLKQHRAKMDAIFAQYENFKEKHKY
jgi:amino acid permease